MSDRYAIFVDAGYFRARFKHSNNGTYPTPDDLLKKIEKYKELEHFKNSTLYRVFYYDALPPALGTKESEYTHKNPFTGQEEPIFDPKFINGSYRTWSELVRLPFFAMRKGTLVSSTWEVSENNFVSVMDKLKNKKPLAPGDIVKSKKQKAVDMKIGMDISHVSIKRLVDKIILIAGDADMAPAAKVARVEGLQVFLDSMGHSDLRMELVTHIDVIIG